MSKKQSESIKQQLLAKGYTKLVSVGGDEYSTDVCIDLSASVPKDLLLDYGDRLLQGEQVRVRQAHIRATIQAV